MINWIIRCWNYSHWENWIKQNGFNNNDISIESSIVYPYFTP